MKKVVVFLGVIVAMLSGCTMFKRYQPPGSRAPDTQKQETKDKPSSEPVDLGYGDENDDGNAKGTPKGRRSLMEDLRAANKPKAPMTQEERQYAEDDAASDLEEPEVIKAVDLCAKNRAPCKARCDAGDGIGCFGLALSYTNARPPDFQTGLALAQKACDLNARTGCFRMQELKDSEAEFHALVARLSNDIEVIATDLAEKKFLSTFAAQNLQGRRNAIALGRMQEHMEAIRVEAYCPKKKNLMLLIHPPDFAALAKKHCEENPPTAGGLSGEQVTLTNECKAVYATPCP
jgi:uncharacterized membrane protein